MLPSRKVHFRIDSASGRLVNSSGLNIVREQELPRLLCSDLVVACVEIGTLSESNSTITFTPKALPESSTYCMLGGADGVSSLLFRSEESDFNLPGSWLNGQDPDVSLGQLTFVLNTATTGFAAAVASRRSVRCDFAVTAVAAGTTAVEVLAKDSFRGESRPDGSTAAAALASQFVTVSQLAAYFRADDGFEFSEDGESFHTTRTAADCYYRYRNSESGLVFCIGPAASIQGVTASQVKKTAVKQALIFA